MSRKLDALFAERVLGCNVGWVGKKIPFCNCVAYCDHHISVKEPTVRGKALKRFTESLDAAWLGVEKLNARLEIDSYPAMGGGRGQIVVVSIITGEDLQKFRDPGFSETLPIAIVKACLLAVGVTEDEIKEAEESK